MSEISDRINRYMTYRECDAATKNMLIDILYHLADLYVGKNVDRSCIRSMHIEIKALRTRIAELETPDFWCDDDDENGSDDIKHVFEGYQNEDVVSVYGTKIVARKYLAAVCLRINNNTPEKEIKLFSTAEEAARAWPDSIAALKREAAP